MSFKVKWNGEVLNENSPWFASISKLNRETSELEMVTDINEARRICDASTVHKLCVSDDLDHETYGDHDPENGCYLITITDQGLVEELITDRYLRTEVGTSHADGTIEVTALTDDDCATIEIEVG